MKLLPYITPKLLALFEAKVIPEPNSGCHIWMGKLLGKGHGDMQIGGRGGPNVKAHRLGYVIHHGHEIPDDLPLLHSCDVACCVNGAHLTPGTIAKNNAETRERGRYRNGAMKFRERNGI